MGTAAPPPPTETDPGTGDGDGDVVLGVDIGGTKLLVGLVDRTGAVRWSARAATPPDDPFAGLAELLAGAPAGWRPVACGVGCGGPMAAGGAWVSPLNIPAWRGFPLRDRLAEVTGLPTWVDNDAKALALGEGWAGAAGHAGSFLAMVVSTGVGGGIVLEGRLLEGDAGNAGHIGHVIVEPDGRRCPCGGRGCLEAEASGTSIAAATGAPAEQADLATRRRTGRLVGRAVASTCQLLDLRLVTVAGSVALGYGEDFFAAAREEMALRIGLDFARGAVIRPTGLGPLGPLVGAAAVAWRGLGADPLAGPAGTVRTAGSAGVTG
jgi:glucokinase